MSKKNVNVSEQLLTSILIGLVLALIVVVGGHLSPKNWEAMPAYSSNSRQLSLGSVVPISADSPVSSCGYECMFGEGHGADCSGHDISNFGSTKLSVGEIFSASFEHISTILIIGLIASAVIYIFKRVSFQVVKE